MAQCTDRMDGMDRDQIRNAIEQGNTALGIEFGSTRIKAVLVDGISLLHRAVMTGKTGLKREYGPIVWQMPRRGLSPASGP